MPRCLLLGVIALVGLGPACVTVDPVADTDERGEPTFIWRRVLSHALDLASEDRAGVDASAAVESVEQAAAQIRERIAAAARDAAARGRDPDARVAADAVAAVLFRDRGMRGDARDPSAESRELFDVDRVLQTSRGTCLAVVLIGLAAAEEAGLHAAPVLTVGHARIAVAPGFLIDPATGGVALPPENTRPAGPEELVADLHANRASYRRAAGDLEGALTDADRAVTLAPKLAVGRINRAAILLDLERTDEAIEELQILEQSGAGTSASAFNLGIATARSGAYGLAKHWYSVATQREPKHVRAWINLGVLHEALEEPVAAKIAYEHALSVAPDHAPAKRRLAALAAQ